MAGAMSSGRTAACSAQGYGFSTEYSSSRRSNNPRNLCSGTAKPSINPSAWKISNATCRRETPPVSATANTSYSHASGPGPSGTEDAISTVPKHDRSTTIAPRPMATVLNASYGNYKVTAVEQENYSSESDFLLSVMICPFFRTV